jgi:aryl-alcohol dehydrogenase-like predicted oxidoreductase
MSPLSPLIVGCWQLDDRSWKPLTEAELERAIDIYIARGITCFDTADSYGRSEPLLGRLLKGRGCTVLTKAIFYSAVPSPQQVRLKVENALRNLGKERLDYLQIHWQDPKLDFSATFTQLAELVDQQKIVNLGVTNFSGPMLAKAVKLAPIGVHQLQYSLIDRRVENGMQAFCQQHGVKILAYGPLAGGFLSDQFRGVTAPKQAPDHARASYYSSMISAHGGWSPVLSLLDALTPIAQAHGKSIAQVALNWVRQQPGVAAVISGLTLNTRQIQQNVEAMTWQLNPLELKQLAARSAELFQQPGDIYSYERN